MDTLKRTNFPVLDPSALSFDSKALGQLKVDCENQRPGDLTGTDCPKCKNKGVIWFSREDGSPFTRECDCMTIRRCVKKMEDSGLKDVIRNYTFEKFQAREPWQKALLSSARDYAKHPEGWFLICGQSGSGKTHLCTAICRELLLQGRQVVYAAWRQEIAEIKGLALDADRRWDKVNQLKTAPILYIDDLFKCGAGPDGEARPTAADISLAFEILNARYVSRLETIVSTEFLPDQLLNLDEATGGRLIEMAGTNAFTIGKDPKRNYRLRDMIVL